MEQNQLTPLTPEQTKLDKEKKSLNRRFGFVLIITILLAGILIFEIISQFIK